MPNSQEAFEGYISGRAILEALSRASMDSSELVNTFYKIQTFSIDGLQLGPFSQPCAPGQYDATGYVVGLFSVCFQCAGEYAF